MSIELSKNILEMSKNAKIRARIKVLEDHFGKSGNVLGVAAGLGNATVDGWSDNQLDKSSAVVEKFLTYYKVNPVWWKTGSGDIFYEKGTPVQEPTDNKENEGIDEIYRKLVEDNTAYRLVPKSILDEEYRIVLKSELDDRAQMWREALAAKNAVITQLEKEISELRSKTVKSHAKQTQ